MVAGLYDFVLEEGATFILPIVIKDNGVPRPLTGYTARMKIKESKDDDVAILELTTSNGRIIIDADQDNNPGQLLLKVDAADTVGLGFSKGVYDLELEKDGIVERILEGSVTYSREVTD